MKMRSVSGFTLIELVVVIGILAILAVIAIPRFIDMRQQAVNATAAGIAGAMASGSAVNFAAKVANNPQAVTVATCGDATAVISSMPAGATIQTPATAVAKGATTVCTVNYVDNGLSANVAFDLVGSS